MKLNRYSIWVSTGGKPLASLYPNVSIQLCGLGGHSPIIALEPDDIFALDTRCAETFVLELPDVGTLTQCWIGYDAPVKADFMIRQVRVSDALTRREWFFEFTPQSIKGGISTQWISAQAQTKRAAAVGR